MTALLLAGLLLAPVDTFNLSLAEALRLGLERSPSLTEASVSKTKGGITLARGIANLLPSISGSIDHSKVDAAGALPETLRARTGWNWTGSLTASQAVFSPTLFAGLANGVILSGYYSAEARDRNAKLTYDIVVNYLGLLKSTLLLDAAEKAVRRAAENLKVIQEKERLGAASRIDLMRTEVQHSQAEIELLSARKALVVSEESFKATVGLDGDIAVRPSEELSEPPDFSVGHADSLVAEIIQRNPGAVLAAKSKSAATWNTVAAISEALPTISAYWTSSYADSSFPTVANWREDNRVSVGIRATFPLLDLKSYVLDVIDARNESRRAQAAARKTTLQLRSAARAAILGIEEASLRYEAASKSLRLSKELYELAKEQHRLGTISLLDLFSVEADLAAATAGHISALSDTYVQAAQVNYLLGLSDADLTRAERVPESGVRNPKSGFRPAEQELRRKESP